MVCGEAVAGLERLGRKPWPSGACLARGLPAWCFTESVEAE